MNREKISCLVRKLVAGTLAVGMIVAGMVIVPKEADAAVVVDQVIYEEYAKTDMEKYWTTSSKKAPVMEGYVFGGWFQEASDESADNVEKLTSPDGNTTKSCIPLTESELTEGVPEKAYAKFVPAQVLSVKAQNLAGTTEKTETTYVRVISSLDSKNYQKVGFDIWLANQVQLFKNDEEQTPLETDKIYDGLLVGDEKRHATEIFGGVSKYVSVWQLTGINNSNFSKIIYVRPYWITMDGTKVEGLAKYVHIEDDYNQYISVPVNLLTGDEVAAGALNLKYDTELEFVGFEAGRLLPEMNYSHNESSKTIKMIGNAKEVSDTVYADGIYANLRFKKPSEDTNFEIDKTSIQFYNWDEEPVDIEKVWDVKYDVKKTTE